MPTYLNPAPDQSDIGELNQQLNKLPDLKVTSDEEVKYLGSRKSLSNVSYHIGKPRQLNVRSGEEDDVQSLGETFHSEIGYHQSKRQKIETPIKLNISPWDDLSRLPSLQQSPDSTLPVNFIVEQKISSPLTSFEEVSSYSRRCFPTSTMPVSSNFVVHQVSDTISGCSVITKLGVMDNSPLDNKHVQGLSTSKSIKSARANATKVYSFKDLVPPSKRGIQAERRPLNHKKLGFGVDIVEPMKCDEGTKCEVNADATSLGKRNKRDVSLVERFTEEEIKLHIMSLKEGSSQVTIIWPSHCFLRVF